MKWFVPALALTLTGCASVAELEQSPETLDVISGKSPEHYLLCVQERLKDSRGPLQVTRDKNSIRVIVPQKLSESPAAVLDISERSSGSGIKLHERLNNFPLRLSDVKNAATRCISG
ncbi:MULTISPECIES: hypothetical protein [unclassified Pseudomonas]|jgi:hypothetical protein|uniref:hypothetical protein n=1 Tax=unclassified Pseudomonas TaxID=196821 RepID=UPI000BA423A7|nr:MULTISPECIES: hypothetical protein [unclassified Pseudomonas]MCU1724266.1 hypothetical protein [Pseudomonas sp. 5P_5.1_Bac1]MCU1734729.1 hypothetical protein [Pseudomonas sp. 20P_3.2_Bac4]MCU1742946.1 hypothetical protein [Pseudomonas sp. 20P_3.2_Bac5]